MSDENKTSYKTITTRFFKRMSVREKLLSLLFVLVLLFLWTSNLFERTSQWRTQLKATQSELKYQATVIARDDEFSLGLSEALDRLDQSKTYSAAQLSGRIDSLLRKSGLSQKADIDPVRTLEGEILTDHNLRVRLSRITIQQIIDFNELIRQESPYINLQKLQLSANRRNPVEIDARFELNSFELR